jgi:HK97 family phage prohead protease
MNHKIQFIVPGRVTVRRNEETGVTTLGGYASVFYDPADAGTQYKASDTIVERIGREAFADIAKDDVRCVFNHDPNHVLGRSANNTLRMSVDNRGLAYEVDLPDTQFARDLASQVERGDITGSSFQAAIRLDNTGIGYSKENGKTVRTIKKCETLIDVGPVTIPAFDAASVAVVRDEQSAAALEQYLEAQRKQAEEEHAERERLLVEAEEFAKRF